jgi:uncharacterized membrane protein
VTDGADIPRGRRALGKSRLESYSDGVFGFATTLLVVDLALHPPGTALQQLLQAWPSFVAYIISFLTIGTAWLAHTGLTERLARADRILLRLNLLLLLAVVFLPFPTRLIAGALYHPARERVFVTLYGMTLLVIRILGSTLDRYARSQHLYAPPGEHNEQEGERRKLLPVVIGYVIAVLIGLALPDVAVALYFGIALYAIVPFRDVARQLLRRS